MAGPFENDPLDPSRDQMCQAPNSSRDLIRFGNSLTSLLNVASAGSEGQTLGRTFPTPVRLRRGVLEDTKARNCLLEDRIDLEVDHGVRLERHDDVFDIERGRRLSIVRSDASNVVDTSLQLE